MEKSEDQKMLDRLEELAKNNLQLVTPILTRNKPIITQFDDISAIITDVQKTNTRIDFDEIGKKVYEKFKFDFNKEYPDYSDLQHEQDRQNLENEK